MTRLVYLWVYFYEALPWLRGAIEAGLRWSAEHELQLLEKRVLSATTSISLSVFVHWTLAMFLVVRYSRQKVGWYIERTAQLSERLERFDHHNAMRLRYAATISECASVILYANPDALKERYDWMQAKLNMAIVTIGPRQCAVRRKAMLLQLYLDWCVYGEKAGITQRTAKVLMLDRFVSPYVRGDLQDDWWLDRSIRWKIFLREVAEQYTQNA